MSLYSIICRTKGENCSCLIVYAVAREVRAGDPVSSALVSVGLVRCQHSTLSMSQHESVASLLGQPALVQLIVRVCPNKSEQEKSELRTKAENQCKTFNGKGKLTVDDLYSVLKVQVLQIFSNNNQHCAVSWVI